ncbi:MAG TPA: hypothetical protein VJ783_13005 [Pirellulales bacterium]|nr:hypothetical protein [Pirellulales bacterium]
MDQVKVYLGVAKKHHFWILVVLIIIIAIVVWMMATSNLAKAFAANKSAIESAKQSVEKAAATGEDGLLPNRLFKEKVDGMHEGLKQKVYEAWVKLYDRQKDLFQWPDMDVGRGQPYNIGKEVKPGYDVPIPGFALRAFNEQYVKNEWKELFESVKIRRPKEAADGDEDAEEGGLLAGAGQALGIGGAEAPVEYEGLVVWPQESRDEIIERYYTDGTPSSLKVRLAQEDYWLFESLIGVINEVNKGAEDSRKAPIKKIEALDVAQWAIANEKDGASALVTPDAGAGPPATGGKPAANGPAGNIEVPKPPEAGGGAPAAAAAGAANDDQALLDGRYIDDKGEPIRSTGPTSDPYAGPYAEFKQVFVHMRLIMDQRKLPELIAACANASLPVETREVRVRSLDAAGPSGNRNALGGFLGMGGMFGGGNREGEVETLNYDALIELSGVIYLYNVPDLAKLGGGTSGSPAKRFFGVPSVAVSVPGGKRRAAGGAMAGMGMMGGGGMGMAGGMGPMGGMTGGSGATPGLMPDMPNMQGMQGVMQQGQGQPGLMPQTPNMRQGGR